MAEAARPRKLIVYSDENGQEPFMEWLKALRDKAVERRIRRRINRMEQGNWGDHKSVGDGVIELRLFFGPGYRVYCAEDGDTIVIILCGGDKSTQDKDIKRAKAYWQDYLRSKA